jgi:hypothetical protein
MKLFCLSVFIAIALCANRTAACVDFVRDGAHAAGSLCPSNMTVNMVLVSAYQLVVSCVGDLPSSFSRPGHTYRFDVGHARGPYTMVFGGSLDYGCVHFVLSYSLLPVDPSIICEQQWFNEESVGNMTPRYISIGIRRDLMPNGDDQLVCGSTRLPLRVVHPLYGGRMTSSDYQTVLTQQSTSYTVVYPYRVYQGDAFVWHDGVKKTRKQNISILTMSSSTAAIPGIRDVFRSLLAGNFTSPIATFEIHNSTVSATFDHEDMTPCHVVNSIAGHTRVVTKPHCKHALGAPVFHIGYEASVVCNVSYSDTDMELADAVFLSIDAGPLSKYFGVDMNYTSYVVTDVPPRSCSYYGYGLRHVPVTCFIDPDSRFSCRDNCSVTGFPPVSVHPAGYDAQIRRRYNDDNTTRSVVVYSLNLTRGFPGTDALNQSDMDGDGRVDERDEQLYYQIHAGTVPNIRASYTACDTVVVDVTAMPRFEYHIQFHTMTGLHYPLDGRLFVHNASTETARATFSGLPVATMGDVCVVSYRTNGHPVPGAMFHIRDPLKLRASCRSLVRYDDRDANVTYTLNSELVTPTRAYKQYISPRGTAPRNTIRGLRLQRTHTFACCVLSTYSANHSSSPAENYQWTNLSHPGLVGIGAYNQLPAFEDPLYSNIGYFSVGHENGDQQLCRNDSDSDWVPDPLPEYVFQSRWYSSARLVSDDTHGYRIETDSGNRTLYGGAATWTLTTARADLALRPIDNVNWTLWEHVSVHMSGSFSSFFLTENVSLSFHYDARCYTVNTVPAKTVVVKRSGVANCDTRLVPRLRGHRHAVGGSFQFDVFDSDVLIASSIVQSRDGDGVNMTANDRVLSEFRLAPGIDECGNRFVRYPRCLDAVPGRRRRSVSAGMLSTSSDVDGDGVAGTAADDRLYYMVVGGLTPYITASYLSCSEISLRLTLVSGYTYAVAVYAGNEELGFVDASRSVVVDSSLELNFSLPEAALGVAQLGVVAWQTGGSGPDPAEKALFYVQNPIAACGHYTGPGVHSSSDDVDSAELANWVIVGVLGGTFLVFTLVYFRKSMCKGAYTRLVNSHY